MSYEINTNSPTQQVYLNTINCRSRSPAYTFELSTRIRPPISQKILLSLHEFTMPNVLNTFTIYNNKISFQENNNVKFTIEIPVGIYTVISFRDFVNLALSNLGFTIVCVYVHKQYRLTFVSDKPVSIINEVGYETTCGRLIGANKNNANEYEYPILGDALPTYTISMPNRIDFRGTPFFFLKIDEIYTSNINSLGVSGNIFARIPVNALTGQVITHRPTETTKFLLNQPSLGSLSLSLEDEFGRELDIGDAEIQAILNVQFMYPQEERDMDEGTLPHFFNKLKRKMDDDDDDEEVEFGE